MQPLPHRFAAKALCRLLCAALALPVPWAATAGERTIRCDSHGFGYNYCRVDTGNRVVLVERHGLFSCREGRSWGYDDRGVWVDKGCSADFRVGREGGHDRAVVGAVIGLAALAAIASSRQKHEAREVAPWAVGTFRGRDHREGVEVEVTVLPGGKVNGRAGSHEFAGSLEGEVLHAGRKEFRIKRQGNGFLAVDVQNDADRVVFQRVGSAY